MCTKFQEKVATLKGLLAAKSQITVAERKALFHKVGRQVLKEVAREIDAKEFSVRSCMGGPGVGGEVILHTPELYLQIVTSGHSGDIMFRTCEGMKDFRGGYNCWSGLDALFDGSLLTRLRKIQQGAVAA